MGNGCETCARAKSEESKAASARTVRAEYTRKANPPNTDVHRSAGLASNRATLGVPVNSNAYRVCWRRWQRGPWFYSRGRVQWAGGLCLKGEYIHCLIIRLRSANYPVNASLRDRTTCHNNVYPHSLVLCLRPTLCTTSNQDMCHSTYCSAERM